jgi:hypothetical protein
MYSTAHAELNGAIAQPVYVLRYTQLAASVINLHSQGCCVLCSAACAVRLLGCDSEHYVDVFIAHGWHLLSVTEGLVQ